MKTDLILLHAPSVYDFRKTPILHGPVSDVVPSTQVFEMYPIGFMTILSHLQQHGLSVRIINVALKMLRSRRFDAEKMIKSLKPAAFGLDLHWMVHTQGALELARIIKSHHPDVPVIFGGLSSSYYHEELIQYPQVDYVVRGDSTEEPLRQLLTAIKGGCTFEHVANLTWKDGAAVRVNSMEHVPATLDDVSFDYRNIMKSCVTHLDLFGHLPFKAWFKYPIVAALSCRGCVHNCAICGGSASAYKNLCARKAPAYRDPELMARDMAVISRHIRAPIIVLGDILQAGREYAEKFLGALEREKMPNHVAFEFFSPPDDDLLGMIAGAVPRFNIQISPESHDERVRRAFGRAYGNDTFERFIAEALRVGCRRIDVFFMIGIPEQTVDSVRKTVEYCGELLRKYGDRVHPFISPLAPFLDPGSRAFEKPEEHGYRLFYRSLEEHRKALLEPSWKFTLNYDTKWMSRDELVEVTYEAALKLNQLKLEYNQLSRKEAAVISDRIAKERNLMMEIDRIAVEADEEAGKAKIGELVSGFKTRGPATICRKTEMNWPVGLIRFNPFRIVRSLRR
jgi:B12-binding domain/radical SAM domain protein